MSPTLHQTRQHEPANTSLPTLAGEIVQPRPAFLAYNSGKRPMMKRSSTTFLSDLPPMGEIDEPTPLEEARRHRPEYGIQAYTCHSHRRPRCETIWFVVAVVTLILAAIASAWIQ